MGLRILFFGELGDSAQRCLGNTSITRTLDETNDTLHKLQDTLSTAEPELAELLNRNEHLCAVNQEIQRQNVTLQNGDEVAFMSPFSGG